ncbi:hypothetical protein Bpfe_017678 [Biomphalaria pfeifferi]|uniref:Uncharacterized protein n=1 Tax=Biomphalaria pfeifferi TaxID=112525 RepID=A0AAD8BFH8_BIOPF|nr:hypothetical protein Bpfe_017678 [Biomphalaria pfeifferi]
MELVNGEGGGHERSWSYSMERVEDSRDHRASQWRRGRTGEIIEQVNGEGGWTGEIIEHVNGEGGWTGEIIEQVNGEGGGQERSWSKSMEKGEDRRDHGASQWRRGRTGEIMEQVNGEGGGQERS